MQLIVGAYPLLDGVSDPVEAHLYATFDADNEIHGLELPWLGAHRGIAGHDTAWLLDAVPARWQSVVTSIPFTMSSLSADAGFGLASRDESGRVAAIAQTRLLCDAVVGLNDAAGRQMISAVELHSAPRGGPAAASAMHFGLSLAQIASWNWGGVRLLVEHVDAHTDDRPPAKGFLSLDDEVAVSTEHGLGVVLNWARSAIELVDPDRVVEHVELVRARGLLEGVVFSGVGGDRVDSHLPFAREGREFGDDDSLLTEARARAVLAAAGELPLVGIKARPSTPTQSLSDRAAMISESARLLGAVHARSR